MKTKLIARSLIITMICFTAPPSLRADDQDINIEEPVNPLDSTLESPEYVSPDEYENQINEAQEEHLEQEAQQTQVEEQKEQTQEEDSDYTEPEGVTVSPETSSYEKKEKKELYKNIALAVLAVVVAVVSIIVVSNNNGSKN